MGYIRGQYIQDHLWPKDNLIITHLSFLHSYSLVLLAVHSLDVLARKDRIVVDDVLSTDVGLGVGIELGGLVREVEVDWVGPGESNCGRLVVELEGISEG
jgi:hypothetical protein